MRMTIVALLLSRGVCLAPRASTRLFSTLDNEGRRMRGSSSSGGGGWDDFDPFDEERPKTRSSSPKPRRDSPRTRGGTRTRDGPRSRDSPRTRDGPRERVPRRDQEAGRINLRALEAKFDHLYGIAPILNALQANRREFTISDQDDEEKPEAQMSAALFIQEQKGLTKRAAAKTMQAQDIERLAFEQGIPIHSVDKGVLNTLSSNRPHQGYVLRCGKIDFEPVSRLPENSPTFWLALDQVVDPQNLGALLRSACVLSGGDIGVLVTAKNSAPPSPVVSAASAGALEVMNIYSTNNLARFLDETVGYRIVAASLNEDSVDLREFPREGPTILVLGSEGHGIRPLVARSCTDFVKIPGSVRGVDSLNVSVSGGILLYHFLQSLK